MRRTILGLIRICAAAVVVLGSYRMAFAATDCGVSIKYDAQTGTYNSIGLPCALVHCDTGGDCERFSKVVGGKTYYNCFCWTAAYGDPQHFPIVNSDCAPGYATSDGLVPSSTNGTGGTGLCISDHCATTCHFLLVPINPPPGYVAPAEDCLPPTYTGLGSQCRYFALTCLCHL